MRYWTFLVCALVPFGLAGCPTSDPEGTQPGDCEDEADNDGDGSFDCEDSGCSGSPACKQDPPPTVEPFIVGGEITRAFAATGALTNFSQPFCTGTLVTTDLVLTAAHCVAQMTPSAIEFAIGSLPSDPGVKSQVEGVAVHPLWNGVVQDGNDLAILRLATPINDIAPVILELSDAQEFVGSEMTLVGYGSLQDGMSGAGVRRLAKVTLGSVTTQTLMYLFDGMGACRGDSGGPSFVQSGGQWRQLGVTSWGQIPCTGQGHYQRLDIHADWLVEQGVTGGARELDCAANNACDGQCENDEDCWDIMCEQGSCTAAPGECVSDGACDQQCGVADPDCGGSIDQCQIYGLYGNGVCDPGCPQPDPDCNQCTPVFYQYNPYDNACYYYSINNQLCFMGPAICNYYGCYC